MILRRRPVVSGLVATAVFEETVDAEAAVDADAGSCVSGRVDRTAWVCDVVFCNRESRKSVIDLNKSEWSVLTSSL